MTTAQATDAAAAKIGEIQSPDQSTFYVTGGAATDWGDFDPRDEDDDPLADERPYAPRVRPFIVFERLPKGTLAWHVPPIEGWHGNRAYQQRHEERLLGLAQFLLDSHREVLGHRTLREVFLHRRPTTQAEAAAALDMNEGRFSHWYTRQRVALPLGVVPLPFLLASHTDCDAGLKAIALAQACHRLPQGANARAIHHCAVPLLQSLRVQSLRGAARQLSVDELRNLNDSLRRVRPIVEAFLDHPYELAAARKGWPHVDPRSAIRMVGIITKGRGDAAAWAALCGALDPWEGLFPKEEMDA